MLHSGVTVVLLFSLAAGLDPLDTCLPPDNNNNNNNSNKAYVLKREPWRADRWPNKQLIYRIDPIFNAKEKATIKKAMDYIASKSCVKFSEAPANSKTHLLIKSEGPACNCEQGYKEGQITKMNLGRPGCVTKPTVTHELLHGLGAQHEQVRPDRDKYIKINWGNIEQSIKHAYFRTAGLDEEKKLPPRCSDAKGPTYDGCFDGWVSDTFGLPYDYQSIMHYHANKQKPEMVALKEGQMLGPPPNGLMTDLDVQKLKKAYGCS